MFSHVALHVRGASKCAAAVGVGTHDEPNGNRRGGTTCNGTGGEGCVTIGGSDGIGGSSHVVIDQGMLGAKGVVFAGPMSSLLETLHVDEWGGVNI